jgi:hypothetical protein
MMGERERIRGRKCRVSAEGEKANAPGRGDSGEGATRRVGRRAGGSDAGRRATRRRDDAEKPQSADSRDDERSRPRAGRGHRPGDRERGVRTRGRYGDARAPSIQRSISACGVARRASH